MAQLKHNPRDHQQIFWKSCLRKERDRRELSIRQIAQEVGISPSTIVRAEQGRNITLHAAFLIARYLNLSVHQLWLEQKVPS